MVYFYFNYCIVTDFIVLSDCIMTPVALSSKDCNMVKVNEVSQICSRVLERRYVISSIINLNYYDWVSLKCYFLI